MAVQLTDALATEYEELFANSMNRPQRAAAIDAIADRSVANKARYEAVGDQLAATPWFVIAAIHNLESSQRFTAHLHNGDPLTARTTQVPAGRPPTGSPPFTWEASAIDALKLKEFHTVETWTLPVMLFRFEKFNGFGYRNQHPEVLSPYLWSFTTAYTKGKFVADHEFSATAVSGQCGAAALLRQFVQRGDVELSGVSLRRARASARSMPGSMRSAVAAGSPPFPGVALKRGDRGANVCAVQDRLRQLDFTITPVAGCPYGPQTETAVRSFQLENGLRVSGRVGKDTWRTLFG